MKIFNYFKLLQIEETKQNIPLAMDTPRVAQQNLKAARCLWQNRFYPEAVFFLQQGIEKGIKSYGYYSGIFDEEIVIKKVKHQGALMYEYAAKKYKERIAQIKQNSENYNPFSIIDKLEIPYFSGLEQKAEEVLEKLNVLKLKTQKKLSNEEFNKYLIKVKKQESDAQSIESLLWDTSKTSQIATQFREMGTTERKRILNRLKWINPHDFRTKYRISDGIASILKNAADEDIKKMLTFLYYEIYGLSALLALAILTQPHESDSRYPNSRNKFNPLNYYTDDLLLIKEFDNICPIAQKRLDLIDHLFTEYGAGWNL